MKHLIFHIKWIKNRRVSIFIFGLNRLIFCNYAQLAFTYLAQVTWRRLAVQVFFV